MERTTVQVVLPLLNNFHISFLSYQQFGQIPSLQGIEIYEAVELDLEQTPYIALYNKSRLQNVSKTYDEEKGCYSVTEDIKLYPDFYIRNRQEEQSLW